ncbi:MAG: hypothetical protein LBD11_00330 [Candidatus Peribacteria bacterium]|nr:hypothetical protein [Candidatus Peribacteria bacterium]
MEIPLSEGKNLSVKAGQFFLLNTSRRDTKAQIKQMIKDSGAKQVFSATAKESGMAIMVAHRPPSKLTQNKVKIRNALFVTLAFSAGVWGK